MVHKGQRKQGILKTMSKNTPNSSNSPVIQSKPVKLDKIDLRIIQDLQANGRITNVELAKRSGISAPPCLRRVRALEDAGLVESYHANINAAAMGYGITVFAQVRLVSQAETDLKKFGFRIFNNPN